jgi:hypothetical protein
MKHLALDVVLLAESDEFAQALLCIRCLCVRHCRTEITERPARHELGQSSQTNKTRDDIGDSGTGDEIIIEITVDRFVFRVKAEECVNLLAHVERGGREVVIKESKGNAELRVICDIKRPVFVKWIAALGIVAHGINGHHGHCAPVLVQRSAGLAKAIKVLLARLATHIVRHTAVANHIGAMRQIAQQHTIADAKFKTSLIGQHVHADACITNLKSY